MINGEANTKPRRRTRGIVVLLATVVVLAVVVVVADIALRAYAEDRARAEISSSLPDTVDGKVDVEIGGFSFLQQYLSGTFDRVTLDAPALSVDGVPVTAHVEAEGVPTDLSKPVGAVSARLSLSEDAVNSVIQVPGAAALTLGDQSVGYDGSISVLGLTLEYLVTAGVSVTADSVVLTPETASLTAGSTVIDASSAVNAVLDTSIPLCIADRLPQGVTLTSLTVVPGSATVALSAADFTLDETSLRSMGTCP
ncbi:MULTISPECIES: LmeA family phospholipid-binding protein [unclassified Agreia]|uniref:LmeA family phospholipid-binding protein n=1 Tax=unclassified Agreia TaxID=2641148 RepID=UPI000A7C3C95|nr:MULTISPECIES: DUF2993 domain-containing protein [unclassified Agreia]